ncbi:NGFI-A-binding protein 2 isoform X1 [Lepisosteus oculatus]|uniref:NGFI-A-binding protein 2 isoform X1 n=1 Tax=Lepisosteus oculatus TaxID=7918 RepID=UPI0035F526F7
MRRNSDERESVSGTAALRSEASRAAGWAFPPGAEPRSAPAGHRLYVIAADRADPREVMSLPRTLGELQLYRVLQRANLLAYYDTFIQQGGDDVQQLCEAGEEEFLEIMALVGMATKPLHVRRLQKALRDWAANPALFNQPLASVPLNSIPLFKIDATAGAAGARKSLSNGQPGSPGVDREGSQERASLTPMRSTSPKSPCSQASPQPEGILYRDKLSPMDPQWLSPDPDGNGAGGSGADEEQPSPPLPPPPASCTPPLPLAPSSSSSSSSSAGPPSAAWPGGRLEPETARAVAESVARLLRTVPRAEPGEVKALLKLNKKLAKTVGHIFGLEPGDPAKEEEIRKYSLIYGRFDSKRREGKQLTHHEMIINEAAAQFCIRDNALLLRRVELFSLARQVARECAYTSTLKNARTSMEDCPLPAQKKIKQEVVISECVSSSHDVAEGQPTGSESYHQGVLRHGADEDSLSGESLDGHAQGVGSQSSHSSSPCPPADPPATAAAPSAWSRHLMQQTLMDEGLRLARLVSHDNVGRVSPGMTVVVQAAGRQSQREAPVPAPEKKQLLQYQRRFGSQRKVRAPHLPHHHLPTPLSPSPQFIPLPPAILYPAIISFSSAKTCPDPSAVQHKLQ